MRVAFVVPRTVYHDAGNRRRDDREAATDGGENPRSGPADDDGPDDAADGTTDARAGDPGDEPADPGGADDPAVADPASGSSDPGPNGSPDADPDENGSGGEGSDGDGPDRTTGGDDPDGDGDDGSDDDWTVPGGGYVRTGAARLDRVARTLADRGHDVTVLCARWWDAADVDAFERAGVDYRALVDDPSAGRSFSVSLPLALRRLSPDVIHVDGAAPGAAVAADYATKLSSTPVVVEYYGADPTAGKGPRAVGAADRLVVPSRMVRTWLQAAGADPEDVWIVPDGVDTDLVRAVPPAPEYEDAIVYAHRLDEGANLESLLLALAELRTYDWTAVVVGDGPERARYEQQVRDLRIDDRVEFLGRPGRRRRVAVYRAARAFVQTAHRCVFPTELAWALCSGCVGIVEYHGQSAAHEVVENRERGIRTTDETELVAAIRESGERDRLDYDPDYDEFDDGAVAGQYVDCYRSLLDDRGLL